MDEHSLALVLALVYAHVKDSDEYTSYVPPHKVRRKRRVVRFNRDHFMRGNFIPLDYRPDEVWIGGHVRRKAMYRRMLSALRCTCKFENLSHSDDLF